MFGNIIGGALNLIGGLEANRSNRVNTTATNRTNIMLAREARKHTTEQSAIDRAMQREFAQHGVSWKAEDARRAGLDPLAAMGSTTLYSPSGHAIQPAQVNPPPPQSNVLAGMGQSLTTAIERFQTADQRKKQNEGLALDNQYKEIRNMKALDDYHRQQTQAPVTAPSTGNLPISGQADSVTLKPAEVTIGKTRGKTAGTHHFGTDYVDDEGYLWEVPQEKLSESLESDWSSQIRHTIVQAGKYVKGLFKPKKYPSTQPRPGHIWIYDKLRGQWREELEGSHRQIGTGYKQTRSGRNLSRQKIYRGKIYDSGRR